MDISRYLLLIQIAILVRMRCYQAKVCQTLIVSNALYNPDTNGYYDVTSEICNGREVYQQRVNSTEKYYMFYGEPVGLYYGWNIARQACSHLAVVYNLNNNRRPDYTLRYWIEKEDNSWYYNFDLRVTCTEGLTYTQLIGVILGSVIGIIMMFAICAVLVKKFVDKRERGRRTSSSGSGATPGDRRRSLASAEDGTTNLAFRNDDMTAYVIPPPDYSEVVGVLNNSVSRADDVNQSDIKLPSYEEAIASMVTTPERGTETTGTGEDFESEQRSASEDAEGLCNGRGCERYDSDDDTSVCAEDTL